MFNTRRARRIAILVDASLKFVILDKVTELGARRYNYVYCNGKGVHAVTAPPR